MFPPYDPSTVTLLLHVLVVVGVGLRVVMMRPPPAVALAWILLVAVVPGVGLFLYLLFGERRVGHKRAERLARLRPSYTHMLQDALARGISDVDWERHGHDAHRMDLLALGTLGMPTVCGNRIELLSDTQAILARIAADVDAARHTVSMEFYIWAEGGSADEVVEALVRAAARGVRCRVLVDELGSRPWPLSDAAEKLRQAGVEVVAALPAGLLHTFTMRNDLRIHRKIVVVDGEIGWTGSLNLVDPRYFKQESGVGQWVDAMVRVQGPAVAFLNATLMADWIRETGEKLGALLPTSGMKTVLPLADGRSDVIVVPSGPGESGDAILQLLLALIYAARRELVITTPYFVPDESMLRALRAAGSRGVKVHLILPEKNDSLLVRYASRSYYQDLMTAGVHVQQYRGGLLHTKSITVDGRLSMIGTVNLDMRSLWLNYEVSLFVFDDEFGRALRALQETYLADCLEVDEATWGERRFLSRLAENSARLVSPLL